MKLKVFMLLIIVSTNAVAKLQGDGEFNLLADATMANVNPRASQLKKEILSSQETGAVARLRTAIQNDNFKEAGRILKQDLVGYVNNRHQSLTDELKRASNPDQHQRLQANPTTQINIQTKLTTAIEKALKPALTYYDQHSQEFMDLLRVKIPQWISQEQQNRAQTPPVTLSWKTFATQWSSILDAAHKANLEKVLLIQHYILPYYNRILHKQLSSSHHFMHGFLNKQNWGTSPYNS